MSITSHQFSQQSFTSNSNNNINSFILNVSKSDRLQHLISKKKSKNRTLFELNSFYRSSNFFNNIHILQITKLKTLRY